LPEDRGCSSGARPAPFIISAVVMAVALGIAGRRHDMLLPDLINSHLTTFCRPHRCLIFDPGAYPLSGFETGPIARDHADSDKKFLKIFGQHESGLLRA
jgi:hypothetical protein